ncbi:Zinc finger BED domain-containing protein 1 [Acipenser ruthenus]|uniref:Zinc finger BED domain-containing protein 1 n=1 Tax=Acipenser ruthenus TaxID=7906 RepID=A0A444U8Z5_ACIRT|nr:Zinc finger BED domain-containing protein 1 [Acipenser ruthenus]
MITLHLRHFSIVEDRGFRLLIDKLEPHYDIPHRTSFSASIIPDLFAKQQTRVKQTIHNDSHPALGMASDIWSSRANDSFISLTVHYLTEDFKMKRYLLDTPYFPEAHTVENILTKWDEVMEMFDVDGSKIKLFSVNDNARNIQAALKRIQNIVPAIPCFGHTLQLGINDAVKNVPGLSNNLQIE